MKQMDIKLSTFITQWTKYLLKKLVKTRLIFFVTVKGMIRELKMILLLLLSIEPKKTTKIFHFKLSNFLLLLQLVLVVQALPYCWFSKFYSTTSFSKYNSKISPTCRFSSSTNSFISRIIRCFS